MAALGTTGTIDNPMADDSMELDAGLLCSGVDAESDLPATLADGPREAECAVCLEALYSCNSNVYRPVVTLRCAHPYHLDCIGSTFNAITERGNAAELRCPLCRSVQPTQIWQFVMTRGLQESSQSGRDAQPGTHTSHDSTSSRLLENLENHCNKATHLYMLVLGMFAVFLFLVCIVSIVSYAIISYAMVRQGGVR